VPPLAFQGGGAFGQDDATTREAVRAYNASVCFMDAQLGRILEALEERGLARDTVIAFTSDHGFQLGEHGLRGKETLFEECVRVPLVITGPGVPGTGESCARVVELVDLFPTLAELCGLPVPPRLDGTSLKPLVESPSREWDRAAFAFALREGHQLGWMVRTERWHFNDWGGRSGEELYDTAADPHELHNLATDPLAASEVAGVRDQLVALAARERRR